MQETPSQESGTRDSDLMPAGGIAKAELSTQSAVGPADIDAFVAAGLIAGPRADGLFDPGDITRLRLLDALSTSGIPLGRLAEAIRAGQLSLDFAGTVVADQPSLTAMTVAEACAGIGMDLDDFRRLMLATGAAAYAADQPIREDTLELVQIFVAARDLGIPTNVVIGVQRSFAMGIRQIVETQRELFRQHIEEPMIAKGMPYARMFEIAGKARVALQRMGYRTTFLLQRRFIEQVVFENLIARFEEALEANAVTRPRDAPRHTVCFLDLSGFTERTERLGDAHAARLATALVEIAQTGAAEHRGQLVKALGDGAMLHFPRADDAVHCALSIVDQVRGRDLPPARAGISTGPVIVQDGDYYGRTVNRAARLIGVAGPEQVLVTAETVKDVSGRAFSFADLGAVRLKGVNEEIHAYAASAA